MKTTRDGRFCMATGKPLRIGLEQCRCADVFRVYDHTSIYFLGVYKPQIRVFEYSEVSMKFDRHTDSENITFEVSLLTQK